MRILYGSLLTLFVVHTTLTAQQPAGGNSPVIPAPGTGRAGATLGQPTLDPNSHLDAYLMRWQSEMKGANSIVIKDCVRTDKENGTIKTWKGEGRYLKPNFGALRLVQQEDSQFYELNISTGTHLYEYRPQGRKLVIHELPPTKFGAFDNNVMAFLFGMSAMDAKKRYELTLTRDIGPDNPHYIYIGIKPLYVDDKKEFLQAQMVLYSATMTLRRFWLEKPNGAQVTWDLPNMDTQAKLQVTDFAPPAAPKGWKTEVQRLPPTTGSESGRPPVFRGEPDR
jgi:TIGR03009 family protein